MVFRLTLALFLLTLMTDSAFAQSPYLFTPTGRDDAAALRAAIIAYRWVQINGSDIRIDAPINLETEPGVPLDNVLVEPAPGIKQTTIHTAIPQDEITPSNPSRAVFNYNGGFASGSFLTTSVPAGVMSVTIRDPQKLWCDGKPCRAFQVGDYINLNDTSRVPNVTYQYAKSGLDGATEIRQILLIALTSNPGELRLYLESPLRRPHKATVVVLHCQPLKNAVFRNLRFTTDNRTGPRVGIHLHMAFNAHISNVTSASWRGFSLILMDSGGRNNIIKDCYAVGVNSAGDLPNGWGIAVEGNEGTKILNSGAERYSMGIVFNYSIDTFAMNSSAQAITYVSLVVGPDAEGNPSMNSGFVGGRVYGGGLGANIGPNCVDCVVDVNIDYAYSGVKVGLGAYNSRVLGSIVQPSAYGVAIDSIYGGAGDGAVSSRGTLLNSTVNCTKTKLVLVKGPYMSAHTPSASDSYYTMGPLFYVCQ